MTEYIVCVICRRDISVEKNFSDYGTLFGVGERGTARAGCITKHKIQIPERIRIPDFMVSKNN